jgi:hypothetical protein
MVLTLLLANGCTALRELPRSEYAAQEERRDVVVEVAGGERVEFESVKVDGDTLTGWRERKDPEPEPEPERNPDGTPPAEPPAPPLPEQRQIALDRIAKMSVKQVSWKRTGLIGGALVAGTVAYLLSKSGSDAASGGDGGGKPPPEFASRR